ncbi:MAG TPA: exodeoxyribonuclease VII small subunit [Sporichthya sp.]|nr:exodeoxyribonuclease VII small subunit [Sporichthya sp.]
MAAKKDPGSTLGEDLAEELGYEEARDSLADIVQQLEAGNLTLEESLSLWERGEALAAVCRARLEGARARLDAAIGKQVPDSHPDGEEQR